MQTQVRNLPSSDDRRHILTINAEEYFHGRGVSRAVASKHWDRLESHLERNIDGILQLLERHGHTATFFFYGWSAERHPALIRRVHEAGHEVASRGWSPEPRVPVAPEQFRESLRRTHAALLAAGVPEVLGYRTPRWIGPDQDWVLDVLAEEGYSYDASNNPALARVAPAADDIGVHRRPSRLEQSIWEVPVSTVRLPGLRLPIAGGNYLRQLPPWLIRAGVARWERSTTAPLVFYFTSWEIDPDQPRITSTSMLEHVRQYRNAGSARALIEEFLSKYRLRSIAETLGLEAVARPETSARLIPRTIVRSSHDRAPVAAVGAAAPVSIVVPLFNEQENVGFLRGTLDGLAAQLRGRYALHFVLVDDGSTDGTVQALEREFGSRSDAKIVRVSPNQGVAAAILTGIRASSDPIVCSIDCDCSYDPAALEEMLPLIEGADLVTASPYHRDGRVVNVPHWRLFLSHNLSRAYRLLLGRRIATYTSCFRVYRRSSIEGIELDEGGFLGIAELLVRLCLGGGVVREHPATLESRLLGASKMKTLRVIAGHLRLLARLAFRHNSLGEPAAPTRIAWQKANPPRATTDGSMS